MPEAKQSFHGVADKILKYSGEESIPKRTLNWRRLFPFCLIVFELLLIWLAVTQYQVEQELGFPRIISAVFVGFLIHHFLPLKYRLPFLFVLFVVTLSLVTSPRRAAGVVILGMMLIGICHLRLKYELRVTIIVAMALCLAAIRLNWISTSWGDVVVPLLASMFMFRLILYIFEMRHGNIQDGWWERINYFFLLPNICFPLFPIIGYQTFLESYYNKDPYTIYQKGIRWIVWGLLQLLGYRVIYYYWIPAPSDVVDAGSLVLYFVTAYMLLLRIAGQAYVILGILCLFGWNLPPMFNRYFLASGFSDLWRRVNLYWKEFMMKVFYYPAYFVFRHQGLLFGTILSLIFAFFMTWVLHSYQLFWVKGIFPVKIADGLFWGTFGIFVVFDSLFQMRKKNRRRVGARPWSFASAAGKSLKVVCFFSFMCVLWSLWESGSLSEWLAIVSAVRNFTLWQCMVMVIVIVWIVLMGALLQYPATRLPKTATQFGYSNASFLPLVALIVVLGIRNYDYYTSPDSQFRKLVASIEVPRWNKKDSVIAEQGYYEPLLNKNLLSSQLFVRKSEPLDWQPFHKLKISAPVQNVLLTELIPGTTDLFYNYPISINQLGMRDKQYTVQKPPGTYRFALLGSSTEMGYGVGDSQTFENLVEARLNRKDRTAGSRHYEILNFAAPGYDLISYVKLSDTKVFAFNPDSVICVVNPFGSRGYVRGFAGVIEKGVDLEYDFLKQIMKKSGCKPGMEKMEAEIRLLPYAKEITEWGFGRIAAKCREQGSIPVWLFMPLLNMKEYTDIVPYLKEKNPTAKNDPSYELVRKLGFVTLDLSGVFDRVDVRSLRVSPWDRHHPNAKGHALIAELLYKKLWENQTVLHFGSTK